MKKSEMLDLLRKVKVAIDTAQNYQIDASTEFDWVEDPDGELDEVKELVDDIGELISKLLDMTDEMTVKLQDEEDDEE
jgi:hypothetical protein